MNQYEQEQQIIDWLKEYNVYKDSIKNLKILVYDIAEEGMGIDYSKDQISPTNKFSSDVENKVLRLDKAQIEKKIKAMSYIVNSIDTALSGDSLTNIEKEVVKNRCIKGLYYYQFCYKIGTSERNAKRKKKDAISKIRIIIFGE